MARKMSAAAQNILDLVNFYIDFMESEGKKPACIYLTKNQRSSILEEIDGKEAPKIRGIDIVIVE